MGLQRDDLFKSLHASLGARSKVCRQSGFFVRCDPYLDERAVFPLVNRATSVVEVAHYTSAIRLHRSIQILPGDELPFLLFGFACAAFQHNSREDLAACHVDEFRKPFNKSVTAGCCIRYAS